MKKTIKIRLIIIILISSLLLTTYRIYQKCPNNQISFKTTSVSTTQRYIDKDVSNVNEAINLIKSDSKIQEKNCNNIIKNIDKEIQEETQIYGVNLCEMEPETARQIYNTLNKIYKEYKGLKGYVTNLSLNNDSNSSHLTSFKPSYVFITSSKKDTFPMVIKSQILLNSRYYLNEDYAKKVINQEIDSGNFLSNTTLQSLLAHEYAHVLTYVLALKYYESVNPIFLTKENYKNYNNAINKYKNDNFSKIIFKEAYKNYNTTESEDDFQKAISLYANKKDALGNVLYNETIAEAFHDYFLHDKKASKESLEIMKVLNKYSINYSIK